MPILDELDNLSPGAKQALAQAHTTLAARQGPVQPDSGNPGSLDVPMTPSVAQSRPMADIGAATRPSPTLGGGAAAQPTTAPASIVPQRPVPTLGPRAQAAEDNVQDIRNSGSGISQIKNPFLRGLGYVGDAVASGLFPRIGAVIPGTTAHHQQVLGGAQQNLKNEEGMENQATGEAEKEAQTRNLDSQPELHQGKLDLDTEKAENKRLHDQATEAEKDAVLHGNMTKAGYTKNEKGEYVPDPASPPMQRQAAAEGLVKARTDLVGAQQKYQEALASKVPEQIAQRGQALKIAQSNHDLAERRLVLSQEQTAAHLHGTDTAGQALPGAMIGDDGKPIGTAFQQNVRPTGQERNKGDLASSAHDQLADIKSIVQKRPDIFGPAAGRKTDFDVWLGSQDPDAQRFRAARTIAGDHLAGVFGGRSEAALHALDNAIGQFKDNPNAVIAGIDQLDKANNRFVDKGTVKTAGSNAVTHPNTPPAPREAISYTANGKTYHIPPDKEQEFLKDFPTAKKANAAK